MIPRLFGLVMVEMALVITMSFGSSIRKVVVHGLDFLKQGRGPLVTKTAAAAMLAVFGWRLYTVTNIEKLVHETAVLSLIDEVLKAQLLLEASLMGFSLFLGFMIERFHYHINKEDYFIPKKEKKKGDYCSVEKLGNRYAKVEVEPRRPAPEPATVTPHFCNKSINAEI